VKRFEELHINDQLALLITSIEMLVAGPGRSFADMAQARDVTALDVWRQICAETGFDECTPWDGFPERPQNLPDAPGGSRELPEEALQLLADEFGPVLN
jgi:hypothetical protein